MPPGALPAMLPVVRLVGLLCSVAVASLSLSCLVTSTEDFPEPPSTPPFLNGSRASPSLSQVLLVDPVTSTPITFSAFVRSEDAGSDLEARLVADWPSIDNTLQITTIGAGTFSAERLISLTWDPRAPTLRGFSLAPGCHPITLVVTHRFNTLSNVPAHLDDSDVLVWWAFLGDPGDPTFLTSFDVSSCPNPRQLPHVEAPP